MWSTSLTQMFARLTTSTLFVNPTFVSTWKIETRSASSTPTESSGKDFSIITKMRELRARGPYALFVKQNYSEIKAKNPNLKLAEISKKMGEAWRSLDEQKKQSYIKQFQDQKSKYEEEKSRLNAADLQTVDADEKSRRLQNRLQKSVNQLPSKRPRSAYAHFLSTLDRGEADISEFMKGAAQRWTHLTEQEKNKFDELHQQEKQQYVKDLVAWAAVNEHLTKPKEKPKEKEKEKRTTSTTTKKKKRTNKTKTT